MSIEIFALLFQSVLLLLLMGLVVVAAIAASRLRSGADRQTSNAALAPAIVLRPDMMASPNREARRLLGLPERNSFSVDDVAAAFGDGAGALCENLRKLAATGAAFRSHHRNGDDRIIETVGEPDGRFARVLLSDQTDLMQRLDRLERERREATEKAASLSAVVKELGGYVITDGEGREAGDLPARLAAGASAVPEALVDGAKIELEAETGVAARQIFELSEIDDAESGRKLRVAKNVTAAVVAERAMDQLVYTMSETFAHLKVGLLIFDAELRLTLFNPAIVDVLVQDAAWLATRPSLRVMLDRLRHSRRLPEQSDFPAWRDELLARVGDEDFASFEENWLLPDGRSIMALFRPHPSGGLAIVIEDVTESLSLKRKSAADRAVSHATTELLDEGIAVFGPDGMLRLCNPAFRNIWGLSPDFCDGSRHVSEVMDACASDDRVDGDFWRRLKLASTNGGGATALREKVLNPEGRTFVAKTSYAPDGSMLAVFAEITAEEKAASALIERNDLLEQSEEMRGALIDQISHQIRTPLNSVLGFGQLLDNGACGELNSVQREYVDGIVDSARDIVEAIDGMSELISIDGAKADPAASPIRLEDNLRDVLNMVKRRFNGRAPIIVLNVAEDAKDLMTEGPKGRLRQVFFNLLLDGATKADKGDRIFLDIERVGDALSLVCSYTCRDNQQRTGLALSLVRRFTRLSGGEASVERGEGGACTVRSRLPLSSLGGGGFAAETPVASEHESRREARAG